MTAALPASATTAPAAAAAAILDVLTTERRLVDDLTQIVGRQRNAVADDDLETVDGTSHDMQRVLFTLDEARRRRRSITQLLGAGDVALGDLEHLLGDAMNDGIREVRIGLRNAADRLAREVAVNRHILRLALDSSDARVARLSGAPAPAGYGGDGARMPGRSGVLVNRRG